MLQTIEMGTLRPFQMFLGLLMLSVGQPYINYFYCRVLVCKCGYFYV